MTGSQQLVVMWIEYAAAGAILLLGARFAVSRLRQPADRIHLILMALVAAAVVPLLARVAKFPAWNLGLVAAAASDNAMFAAPPREVRTVHESPLATLAESEPIEHSADAAANSLAVGRSDSSTRVDSSTAAATAAGRSTWEQAAIALATTYCGVFVLFVAEGLLGVCWLRRLSARAVPATRSVYTLWESVSQGRGHAVRLLISSEVKTPLAFGCWRPTVVIPESMTAGDAAALRFCLAHEWSHIARGDLRAWRLTWACQFLLWFQPLFWALRRELRVCQDLLADHRAAGAGGDRIEYSELLMALARRQTQRPIAGAIAFLDRSSQLSRRINMLLASTLELRSRSPLAFRAAAAVLLLACSVLIAAVRLDSAEAGDGAASANSAAKQRPGADQPSEKRPDGDGLAKAETKFVRCGVVDEAGMPVSGARLWLLLRYQPRRVVEGTTDDSGRFEMKFPADWINPRVTGSSWTIWAYAPGHSIATQSAYQVLHGTSDKEIEIKLEAESNTRFKVLTPAGEPLAGAVVRPQNYSTTVGYDLVPEEMLSAVSARTDADGVATLSAIQPGLLFRVQVVSETYGKQSLRVDRDPAEAVRGIRLRKTAKIVGRLTGERPEWLRGVRLNLATDNQDEWNDTQGEARAVTDDDGYFKVPAIASGGPLHMYVDLDPALPVRPQLNDKLYLEAGETLKLEIPLVPAPKVHGKVIAKSNGKPIAKAEISLGYGGFRQSDHVVTNDEGRFEGRALPGPVRVQIISLPEGYVQLGAPWAEPYQLPPGVEEFELPAIEVASTHKLSGRLIGAKDEPLPEVQVMAVYGNRRYGFAKTDAEGRFTMNVPDGIETEIEVYSDGRGQEPVTVVKQDPLVVRYAVDSQTQAMEAERAKKADVALTGSVLAGNVPLANVKLTLFRGVPVVRPARPGGKPPAQPMMAMRNEHVASAETDADGRYRLQGLKAGDSYQIEVRPPFAAADPAWQHQLPYLPKLPDNAKGEVALPDLKLHKLTQTLAGQVVDPDGQPVAGATVSAQLRDGFTSIPRLTRSGPPPWTETDQEGRFKLQQLPDEPLALMAYIRPKSGGQIRFLAKLNVELNQQDIRIVLDPSLVEEEE